MLRRSQLLLQAKTCIPRRVTVVPQWQVQYRQTFATDAPFNDKRGNDSYGLVTTTSPHNTTIDQLLAELKNAERFSQNQVGANGPSLLALFLTPSYAQHALDPELPLKAFEKLNGSKKHGKEVRTITAVVDRLPMADQQGDGPSKGAEGLAYNFVHTLTTIQEELLSSKTLQDSSSVSSKQLSQPRPGNLWFRVDGSGGHPVDTDLQLPLAQTVFSTGRTSTMFASTLHPDTDRLGTLILLDTPTALESQHLPITFSLPHYSMITLIPLITLTLTRRVVHCMGNIVRTLASQPTAFRKKWQLKGEPNTESGETQPASSELEAAIKKFFSRHNLVPRPVQVWALIIPASISPGEMSRNFHSGFRDILKANADDMDTPLDPVRMQRGLGRLTQKMGARLCRVLSGGGGWGKKAGLLSLDPETNYSGDSVLITEGADVHLMESFDELEQEKKSALGEIVKEGDHIVFLLGPPAFTAGESEEDRQKYYDLLPKPDIAPALTESSQSLIFGCLPSSVDDVVPAEGPGGLKLPTSSSILHLRSTFGILSEGGMALTSSVPTDSTASVVQSQTKIDVPFSKMVFLHAGAADQPGQPKQVNTALGSYIQEHEDL